MATIRYYEDGKDRIPANFTEIVRFDDGAYAAFGTAEELELLRNMVTDLFNAGRAHGIREAIELPQLTPAEIEALTS